MRPADARLAPAISLMFLISLSACEPQDRRLGFWLSGEVVEDPIDDWSFADAYRQIFVETRTWYGIPHSVTTTCVRLWVRPARRESAKVSSPSRW